MVGALAFGWLISAALAQNSPAREVSAWIPEADYPLEALKKFEEGVAQFQVEVDAEGRPGNCVITESSGSATLDAATCKMMLERARFSPALDDQGKTVPATFSRRVNWKLPNIVPTPTGYEMPIRSFESFPLKVRDGLFAQLAAIQKTTATVRLDIDETGKLAGCHLLEPTGVSKVDALVCKRIKRWGSFKPAHTRDGQPKRASITQQVQFHGSGDPVSLISSPEESPD
ncbi:MAG TPA: TonB family protein [Allosphingosinicella sp.]|jgi:TonB family protein|uniref:TonB family protein n=1 Tax=Allosphingosinicella sp. TaxID=2823234 RepID=UPI002F2846F1